MCQFLLFNENLSTECLTENKQANLLENNFNLMKFIDKAQKTDLSDFSSCYKNCILIQQFLYRNMLAHMVKTSGKGK